MENGPLLEVKVAGEFACFTRPEMKVERVSYPVMTPSAARGVLEAIFWKPQFRWHVREILVLRPIRHFSILRNEVNSKAAVTSLQKGRRYFAEEDRAQRHTLGLRDVAYLVRADMHLHVAEDPAKYRDQFRRRVRKGQCFQQPYLGCREFPARFSPPGSEEAIDLTDELGLMLFDIDYDPDGSGRGTPRFFRARLERGVLRIPAELYAEVQG